MKSVPVALIVPLLLLCAGAARAHAAQDSVAVREVASDTLRDVAMTVIEGGRPVIYYNPTLMQQVGPQLAQFFMAHEYGHVRHGHTGAALAHGTAERTDLRLQQELEADCYATRTLYPDNRAAVDAAVQFFTQMGPFRFDKVHPSGSQRAAKILSCIPDRPETG